MNEALIVLKYEEDFFKDKRWERILDFFNFYMRARKTKGRKKTLYKFTKDLFLLKRHAKYEFEVEEIRELFQFVREKNYEVFKMFYE